MTKESNYIYSNETWKAACQRSQVWSDHRRHQQAHDRQRRRRRIRALVITVLMLSTWAIISIILLTIFDVIKL